MNSDSIESRVGRLEQEQARQGQRLQDLGRELTNVAKDARSIAVVNVAVARLESSVAGLEQMDLRMATNITEIKQALAERDRRADEDRERQMEDSKSWRRALILGSFTVLASVIGAAAMILTSAP